MKRSDGFVFTDIRLETESPDHTLPIGRKISKAVKSGKPERIWGTAEAIEENGKRFVRLTLKIDKEFFAKGYRLFKPKDGIPVFLSPQGEGTIRNASKRHRIESVVAKDKKKV